MTEGESSASGSEAPLRVDILIETPAGGVALGELLGTSAEILLRTREGPKLVRRETLLSPAPA